MNKAEDLTGRRLILRNTVVSWASMLIMMVVGFVLPRVIDERMGQATLGVWDFCWSIVNYLGFINLGVSAGVNRFVATFRATKDTHSLSQVITTNYILQAITAIVLSLALAVLLAFLPAIVKQDLDVPMAEIKEIVLLLGGSILFQLLFAPARGVINGCHRWDITNIINVGMRLSSAGAMIIVAMLGGRLGYLAWAYLLVNAAGEVFRFLVSRRVCPEARIARKYASIAMARRMFHFGAYQNLLEITPLMLLQAVNLLVMGRLGAESLAILARHIALIKYIELFVSRFSRILNPSTAALCALDRKHELQDFLVKGTRYAAAMALPMLASLTVLGDKIMLAWMGVDYVRPDLVIILSLGYVMPIMMSPAQSILIGMNEHSRVTRMVFLAIVTGFLVGILVLDRVGWSLRDAVIMETLLLTAGLGLIIPSYCCRRLELGMVEFLLRALPGPFFASLLFAGLLVLTRWLAETYGPWFWVVGLMTSCSALFVIMWCWILPDNIKLRICQVVGRIYGNKMVA